MIRFPIIPLISISACALLLGACSRSTETAESTKTTDIKEDPESKLPDKVTFNAHIRPIFSDTCFACHGFDAKHREAGLRLDTPEGAYAALKDNQSGLHAIAPGDPEQSAIWQRLVTDDPEEIMPPPDFHKPISDYQKQLVKRWITQGAEYQEHWAYTAIKQPPVPAAIQHPDKVANSIDPFILKKLEEEGISPTPRANKATLLRRLSLDLTGIAPTPEELEAYLSDDSPNVYEKQVDRLLASPRYGERMAVQWLDVARYADTVGLHGDQYQNIFPYRDYVINAFNNNMPFDQFTIEQLAGDLLEKPTEQQSIATGFIRLAQMTREGGAQPKEYLAKYASDRVRAIGAAWLGQTTGCAECHDHKFDPISAKDFYSLSAFFKDVKEWGVYTQYKSSPNPDLKGFNNQSPFPPEILIESPSYLARIHSMQNKAYRQQASHATLDEDWVTETRGLLKHHPDGWSPAKISKVEIKKGTPHRILDDSSLLLTGPTTKPKIVAKPAPKKKGQKRPPATSYEEITLTLSPPIGQATAIQVELLPHKENGGFLGRTKDGLFSLIKPTFSLNSGGETKPVDVQWAQADHYYIPGNIYENGFRPLGLPAVWKTGKFRFTLPDDIAKHPHTALFILKSPIIFAEGDTLQVTLKSDDIGRVRISTTQFPEPPVGQAALTPELLSAFNNPQTDRSIDQTDLIRGAWALAHLAPSKLSPGWPALQKTIREGRGAITRSMIALSIPEKEIPVTRILPRGDWQNESGPIVEPAVPHFLPQPPDAGDRRLNRLDLAKWLVADNNPLTARHTMNRLWKQFYGKGISNILDDLGSQGEWPSHPELIDWLANEFRTSGWDIKHMVKLMVMSNTYQQKAAVRDDLYEIDPYNRLLAQQSARRLDAEFIRDNALAIAGLLETDYVGGPSVYPYQPAGYYAPLQFPDRKYVPDTTGGQYRRSVYMHWQRTFLHPMLANFDAPSREECVADRLQSNSPLQALTLLNDPAAVEMARSFAADLINSESSNSDRITRAYQRALSRSPSQQESDSMLQFITAQQKHYLNKPADATALIKGIGLPDQSSASELAAWTQACRVLFNLHETITRY
jgi:mono/diheme cytochrome c family protein